MAVNGMPEDYLIKIRLVKIFDLLPIPASFTTTIDIQISCFSDVRSACW